jgi:hypothetical protein
VNGFSFGAAFRADPADISRQVVTAALATAGRRPPTPATRVEKCQCRKEEDRPKRHGIYDNASRTFDFGQRHQPKLSDFSHLVTGPYKPRGTIYAFCCSRVARSKLDRPAPRRNEEIVRIVNCRGLVPEVQEASKQYQQARYPAGPLHKLPRSNSNHARHCKRSTRADVTCRR